jgi:hypothetical protein
MNKQYEELSEMLIEWLRLYDTNDKNSFFINKETAHKYKLVQNYLKTNFTNDTDLKEHIEELPNIWILKKWLVEIIFVSCFVLFAFGNPFFFKIHTGILFPTKFGKTTDMIYIIVYTILPVIYIFFFHARRQTYNDLKYGMLEIRDIVKKKV